MTPTELVALAQRERDHKPPRCKICDGEYAAHVNALLDAGFGPNQIERIVLEKLTWRVYASTVRSHQSHRDQSDA